MNWNISAWSIRNPVPTIVLFVLLSVAGIVSFFGLGIASDPDIDTPSVTVTVNQIGAAAVELETQVTRKIEDAVAGVGNIKHITSTIQDGTSTTRIEFIFGTNIDRAVSDTRDAIANVRSQLPQGIEEPLIRRNNEAGGPFIGFSVVSDQRSPAELTWLVDNQIARSVLSVPGVARVYRYGGVNREVRVNLDPARLQALGITAEQVQSQIQALNINLPGGRGEVGINEQTIRVLGGAATVQALRETRIALPRNRWARLDTLGSVTDAAADQRQLAYLDGKEVVAFDIARSKGSNLVQVETGIRATLDKLQQVLPPDIKILYTWGTGEFVRESYEATVEAVVLGGVLAVLVIWLFLKDWRSTWIAGVALPLSAIPTFAVLKLLGFTLNNMSLLGLALVVGILVDDAIVEIENIFRHLGMGKSPYQAAYDAADEIGLAVVATTMTIVAVFVPVSLMSGIQGQFYRQFGLTVAAAVLFSLLVARMLTPLLAAYFLKAPSHPEAPSRLVMAYKQLLAWVLDHRGITLGLAGLFFVGSILLLQTIPTSLVGVVDDGQSTLKVELAPGTSFEETQGAVNALHQIILARPEVRTVQTTVGTYDSGGRVSAAAFYITLKPKAERTRSKQDVEQLLRVPISNVPGLRFSFSGTGWDGEKTLRVVLKSDDPVNLETVATQLTREMRGVTGLADIASSAAVLRPELQVRPNFARAAEQGVSVQAIARTALIATLGDREANLAKFNLPGRQINIRVQLDPSFRNDIESVRNLQVATASGALIPLRSVADVRFDSGEAEINRFDRARQITVGANLAPGQELGPAVQKVLNLATLKKLPLGVEVKLAGSAEEQADVFNNFGFAIGSAVLLIYAVLALLFVGFLQPLTIMVSLPLALGGAALGLILFGKSLGLYALIGIIMLMGLVTKNAILLVEYALLAIKEGKPRLDALILAGESRLRPILMTTIAMVAGMLPIALSIGQGAELRSPMAVAVVGGLCTSTVLTLLVVPVVFTVIDDLQTALSMKR